MKYICYNGIIIDAAQPILAAANRGYRYGDGFFETMRVVNGAIPLLEYHKKRIQFSLETLQYISPVIPINEIIKQSLELCEKNKCQDSAKIRLSFSNGDGSVFDDNQPMDYLIEATPIPAIANELPAKGLITGVCQKVMKSNDLYSNLKSANYLVYRIAADDAKRNDWDDALIINHSSNIIETSISNIFWIKGSDIFTPPLSEGCVCGTMRNYLIDHASFKISEQPCSLHNIELADEIFTTNAVSGIRWIEHFNNRSYSDTITKELYQIIVSLFQA